MKKKIIGVFTMLATFLLLLVTSQQVFAQNAVISGKVKIWSNALARQFRTGILDGQTGSNPVGNSLTGYSDVRVFLLDGSYNILAETFSGGAQGEFTFTDVPDGTYYVAIARKTITTENRHDVIGVGPIYDVSSSSLIQLGNISEPVTVSNGVVTIAGPVDEDGDKPTNVVFGVVRQPYALHLTTKYGKFLGANQSGELHNVGQEINVADTTVQKFTIYEGGVVRFSQNGGTFASMAGVLDGDRINDVTDRLIEPTLSDEEQAEGYTFVGWMIDPDYVYPSSYNQQELKSMKERYAELEGKLLTATDVLSIIAKDDMAFRAVFNKPKHVVSFLTNSDYGSINGDAEEHKLYEGNSSKIGELPVVIAKEGYEFIGWYTDETTNVIDNAKISDTLVTANLIYYAKYRPTTPVVAIDPNTNTWIINGKDTGISAKVKDGKDGKDGKVPVISINSDTYTWVVDGVDTGVSVQGQNGRDGKDGKVPVISINSDTYTWVVDGVDTGVSVQGQNGRDGKAPVVSIDSNTNTWIIDGKDTGISANGWSTVQPVGNQINQDKPVYQTGGLLPKTGVEGVMTSLLVLGTLAVGLGGYVLGKRKTQDN